MRNQSPSRSDRAIASYKPATQAKQQLAAKAEDRVTKIVAGTRTDDAHAIDVIANCGRRTIGIEVKSVIDNANAKITVHPDSLVAKAQWAKKSKAELHTVVVDVASGKMLHRVGVGSFRLHNMTPVRSSAHLRELLGMK